MCTIFITHLIGSWLISFDLSIVLYLANAWEVSTDFGLDQNLWVTFGGKEHPSSSFLGVEGFQGFDPYRTHCCHSLVIEAHHGAPVTAKLVNITSISLWFLIWQYN